MCYVLALLVMHVEGGPLHLPLLRNLSFLVRLSPSSRVD